MRDHYKESAFRAAIVAGLLCLLLIGLLTTRAEALTGNIDVSKAQPSIDAAIEDLMQHPYIPEPEPEPTIWDLIREIWERWWQHV